MKPLPAESERDLKSHPMRSKLLSLHLVLTILSTHMSLLTSPMSLIHSSTNDGESTVFVQAIKQYLCLSLSRNAVSAVLQVFEASVEIFWLVLKGMRRNLKVRAASYFLPRALFNNPVFFLFSLSSRIHHTQREIEVLFSEIFIPILEMRTSTPAQKLALVSMLQRLCQDPQALVEIYLNYDCDASAVENIYERIVGVVSKQAGAHPVASKSASGESTKSAIAQSPTQPGSARSGQHHSIPPSLSTTATTLTDSASDLSGAAGLERKLQAQSLESLVFVLRSLVAWRDAAQAKSNNNAGGAQAPGTNGSSLATGQLSTAEGVRGVGGSRSSSDGRPSGSDVPGRLSNVSGGTGGGSIDLRAGVGSGGGSGALTPVDGPIEDDPDRFENERMRKMTMAEGIRLFNSKPKKVGCCC